MDIEKLLKELRRAERYCLNDYSRMAGESATALSTLQAENEKLRVELQESEYDSVELRAELEQVKRERDEAIKAAQELDKIVGRAWGEEG